MDERLCYPIVIRLDAIDRVILCSPLLNVWNLITDLPGHATLFDHADARATAIYDKLFWGCNVPAMTPAGEHFTPSWSSSELAALKHLLLLSIAELRARLR